MTEPEAFANFLTDFFKIFTQRGFSGGTDFLTYLNRPAAERTGDEASVVDVAIVGQLLGLLGFEPAERTYNLTRGPGRPDYAPREAVYGTCFMVEDKNTTLDLDLDMSDPESHLSQLAGYVRGGGVLHGWLCNGRRLVAYRFDDPSNPTPIIDLDIVGAITEWTTSAPPALSATLDKALRDLFDIFHKESFANPKRLEEEIAIDLAAWERQALPLGTRSDGTKSDGANEALLVEALQSLVGELQRDARRILDDHLRRYADYKSKAGQLTDGAAKPAAQQLDEMRANVTALIAGSRSALSLDPDEHQAIEEMLTRVQHDPSAFVGPASVVSSMLEVINGARRRSHGPRTAAGRPLGDLKAVSGSLHAAVEEYLTSAFGWHQRQANLRQAYRADIGVHDDYTLWTALVQETMLGELDEGQRLDEFSLQAAYVVFIRILLIRVCEDKEVFTSRFLSDGGLLHWQEDIQRYLRFANGNPYSPLLDMAYRNAQNIYAHFFTGRELFNWYQLDQGRLVMTLHRLSRFNFAGVDSDIIGTIYNTYVGRKEKREKGQYYTPTEIIEHILDGVGYRAEAGIVGSAKKLIDPACGSGRFLVAAARRLVSAYKGKGEGIADPVEVLKRVKSQLYGFDLNPFACYLAEVNLLIQVLDLVKLAHDKGERAQLERFHIYNVDTLARPQGRYRYAMFNVLQAEEDDIVDQIKSRAADSPYVNGFAFVVANPPYGAKLSDAYKERLRVEWPEVFHGKPDTYTFFMKLGIELLGPNGRLGFITPNTYLTGTNTKALRGVILSRCRVERIVDLPQGIWEDATVDCVLLFLAAEADASKRDAQQVMINLMDVRGSLKDLQNERWIETLEQAQGEWARDPKHEFNIRYNALSRQIEEACRVPAPGGKTKVLRLDDVTESAQGIIVYKTAEESAANLYIKPEAEVPPGEPEWKPLLDGDSSVGRYGLRWDATKPHLKYGSWLWRARAAKFFDSPKLLFVRLMNKSIKRRLVSTFDDAGFYNRDNFNNIIARDPDYDLKYVLALFNSSALNYWYKRKFDNVNINPESIRQLPVHPADRVTQDEIVALVDQLLEKHAELNRLRGQGYKIEQDADGTATIDIPYDTLLSKLQGSDPSFATVDLYDARVNGMYNFPARCSPDITVSRVFISDADPTAVVLRFRQLWIEVPDDDVRKYLFGYLRRPRWKGKTWADLQTLAFIPETPAHLKLFFEAEARERAEIEVLLSDIARLDAEVDTRVLDLYGVMDPADRARILGDAPPAEEAEAVDGAAGDNGELIAETAEETTS
jgi:type I restriction enzyme M protein